MKHTQINGIILVLCLFVCHGFSQESPISEYRLGPLDVLEITVVGDETLSRIYKVSEGGTITFPYHLGEIEVEGLTKSELERKIAELLDEEDILKNPEVIILIREYVSKRVAVLGAVQTPGMYELSSRFTLRQIIARAGGETTDAGDDIVVIRSNPDGTNSILPVSKEELYRDADFDVPLASNDIVRVLPEEFESIYVGGQVNSPGQFEVKKSAIPTLLQAIILAGDFTERASEGGVILRRMDRNGNWRVSRHNVNSIIKGKEDDIQLLPNDIVIVPKSTF